MIKVQLYDNENVYNLDFVQNKDKFQNLIVVPNPVKADALRAKLKNSSCEIITISKFVKDLLLEAFPEQKIEIKRKSELLLIAASFWKIYCKERNLNLNYDLLMKGFNLCTELRGYSLELELIKPILKEYSEEIEQFIIYFYHLSDSLNLIDEHKAYKLLSDYFREVGLHDVNNFKNIIFFDFTFLAGSQIDFINALSTKNDVYIPFPEVVFKNTREYDWIRWLKPEESKKNVTQNEKSKLNVTFFPKQKLNQALSHDQFKNHQIIFTTSSLDELNIFDNGRSDLFLKFPVNLFHSEVNYYFKKINDLLSTNTQIELKEIGNLLATLINQQLQESTKNFRRIKVGVEIYKLFQKYFELSTVNTFITNEDLKVIASVAFLNLPRSNLFTFSSQDLSSKVYDLNTMSAIPEGENALICVSSYFGTIKMSEEVYPEKVFKILTTLGPVKRNALQFYFTKYFLETIMKNNCHFLIENGYIEHDLGWSEFFENFVLNEQKIEDKHAFNSKPSPLKEKKVPHLLKSLSAHKLQTYIDCPQKYYYSYVDKIKIDLKIDSLIQKNELGILEHKVIEKYFNKYSIYDETKVLEIARSTLDKHLLVNKYQLSSLDYLKAYEEICLYGGNGIKIISEFKKHDPDLKLHFEYEYKEQHNGLLIDASVDCVIETSDGFGILDFKRSSPSIPTIKAFYEFEKIQIHFYIKFLQNKFKNLKFFGYINLETPEKSLIFTTDEKFQEMFDKNEFLGEKARKELKIDFIQMLEDFEVFYKNKCQNLNLENEFRPYPRNSKICDYCDVAMICDRGRT